MRMRWFTAIFCWILWGTPVFGQTATDAKLANATEWTESNLPDLVKLYRHFHTHPELSFQEVETSKRLASEWRKLGFAVTESVGQHGIVGLLENGEGPTLMLRCDMDALPITEDTNLVYASKVKVPGEDGVSVGVMHGLEVVRSEESNEKC